MSGMVDDHDGITNNPEAWIEERNEKREPDEEPETLNDFHVDELDVSYYEGKKMETFKVTVKNIGHWYETWEVEAESEEKAKENWHDGGFIEAYEHCTNETVVQKEVEEL